MKAARKRVHASITFSRWPKALIRMKPWPAGPKPTPGVVTTCTRRYTHAFNKGRKWRGLGYPDDSDIQHSRGAVT